MKLSQDLITIASQLKNIKGVNTVNSRRILVIYQWRLTHNDLQDMAIFRIRSFRYTYYKGYTYVLSDTGMIHPDIGYFGHYPIMFREIVIPRIKTVKTEYQWKLIEDEMISVLNIEDRFDRQLELIIVVTLFSLMIMVFLYCIVIEYL